MRSKDAGVRSGGTGFAVGLG